MSYVREPFEELDVLNNFMFNQLTTTEVAEKFCKCLIKNLIGREVSKITVHAEKLILPEDPEKRGVRLDVEVRELNEDESTATIYDIEPHRDKETSFPKKNRFTQAQIDKKNLDSGDNDFDHLPDLFIINITNYDPFGYDRMIYKISNSCEDEPDLKYNDGVTILYFNTSGHKGGSDELKSFLTYLEESTLANAVNPATKEINNYVDSIKHNPTIGGRHMTFGDLIDKIAAEAATAAVATATATIAAENASLKAQNQELRDELAKYKSE